MCHPVKQGTNVNVFLNVIKSKVKSKSTNAKSLKLYKLCSLYNGMKLKGTKGNLWTLNHKLLSKQWVKEDIQKGNREVILDKNLKILNLF